MSSNEVARTMIVEKFMIPMKKIKIERNGKVANIMTLIVVPNTVRKGEGAKRERAVTPNDRIIKLLVTMYCGYHQFFWAIISAC